MRLSLVPSLLSLWAISVSAHDSDVLDLDATNFDSVVGTSALILVEFFAPWCGHCKALAPHYEEAATALKERDIPLAKVDCVDQADLCQKHGVQGYPTVKVFRNGTAQDYSGPRKADGIISYMIKQSLPAVSEVTAANHEEFQHADKVVVIAYVSETSDAPAPAFSAAAEKHRDDFLFGLTTDAKAIADAGVTIPAIVVYRSFDEPKVDYPADGVSSASLDDIVNFVKNESLPLFDEVHADNYQIYASSGLPLAYLFIDPADETRERLVEELKGTARKEKGNINFVWIDATKFAEHAKALNLQEAKWPAFVIQDLAQQLKYPLDQAKEVTKETVSEWVTQFVAGELKPQLKSQPVPESQNGSVYEIVGSEFDQVVFDDGKDVFVEFYASWCGHCKRLKPIWDSLGDHYAAVKDRITIAKMEATENDLPPSAPFRVSGFPTLKFKKAGTRDFIDYEGDRSFESLVEFVDREAKNPLDIKDKAASPIEHDNQEYIHQEL